MHGPFHIGTGNRCIICGGKRPKKVKIVTKIGKKGVLGHTLHKTRMCVCTTILPLFQDNYPNCAPQALQDKHPLWQLHNRLHHSTISNPKRTDEEIKIDLVAVLDTLQTKYMLQP